MSIGPPFTDDADDSATQWNNWRDETKQLEYPDRDIRMIFPPHGGAPRNPEHPADFGDFNPQPDDPHPDVWPVEEFDPGHSAEINDLVLISNSFPAPHVAWVTPKYLNERYGYDPVRQEVAVNELPKWNRPENAKPGDTVEIVATNPHANPMELTEDRIEALSRIAKLWNGETVNQCHLLLDKCPDWSDFLADLNQAELKRLVVDPTVDSAVVEVFGDYDWFEVNYDVYVKPIHIMRKKVWYAPTQRGRTLINKNEELPNLIGDPNEGLAHRVTVGLGALREKSKNRKVSTYYNINSSNGDYDYVVDLISESKDGHYYIGEVVTGHNNWSLHRDTYEKLAHLNSQHLTPYVLFDGRDTAYKVFNHWQKEGLCELPGGSFDSDFNTATGREKVQEAYGNGDCVISDWSTTTVLWRDTLGSDDCNLSSRLIKSLDW